MKKLVLIIVMMLTVSTTMFGRDSINYEDTLVVNVDKYNMNNNVNGLVKYLDLDDEQRDFMVHVHNAFEEALKEADMLSGNEREMKIKCAIKYITQNMRNILDEKQMKKYLRILNVSLKNRQLV